MRRLRSLSRAGEWWSHKLAPLLGTGYATAAYVGVPVLDCLGTLALVLLALLPGAAYVSVLNDLTDLDADRAAGKVNRAAGRERVARVLLAATLVAGTLVAVRAWRNEPAELLLYAGAWVSFALYSARPFRLKERGIAGALADAAGAQLLPHLLLAVAVLSAAREEDGTLWLAAVGVWAAAAGVRGALLHQVSDADADDRAGVRTFASARPAAARRLATRVVFPMELAGVAALVVLGRLWAVAAALVLYAAFERRRARRWHLDVVVVAPTADFRIALHEHYVTFAPLALLLAAAIRHPEDLVVLALHLLLFAAAIGRTVRDAVEVAARPWLGPAVRRALRADRAS